MMPTVKESYDFLLDQYKELYTIRTIRSVLFWDMNTYLPSAGREFRGEQIAYLQKLRRKVILSSEFEKALNNCLNAEFDDYVMRRNIELLNRQYLLEKAVPLDLLSKIIKQQAITFGVWKRARSKGDFSIVKKEFEKLFELTREKAELLHDSFEETKTPYEALVFSNEPNFPLEKINELFSSAKSFLVPFIKKHKTTDESKYSFLTRKISRDKLIKMTHKIAELLMYDISGENGFGRIDEVPHPVTVGCGPRDVRVTVRYLENNFMMTLKATAHEIGHALHGLDWDPNYLFQPIQQVYSPSFGESQSRYVENIIGFSKEYWEYLFPVIQKLSEGVLNDISLDLFYEGITQVKPSLLRVGSDEVTYSLHIIIRHELEQELFSDKISIDELPGVWNERYEKYLGVKVPHDGMGVLQDIHWYQHFWGYFFGYAMGDYIASQLGEKMDQEIPEWKDNLREGKFEETRQWLRERIHYPSGKYDTLELVEYLTGKPLTIDAFKNRITRIYSR